MAQTSGFFDAEELVDGSYDREYVAEQWANYFKLFIGNGVFATPTNQLKIRANSGLNIKALSGWGWINGYWYHNDADLAITISANTSVSPRTDGIFLRFDSSERIVSIVVGTGRTTPNRTAPYYELKLAEVSVGAGVTALTDSNITDTRADTTVCGFVTGLIDVIDSGDLFIQYQTMFDEWFENVRDQLGTDIAGHLQNEIDNLVTSGRTVIDVVVPTTGWSGASPTFTKTITVAGITSDTLPTVTVKYPDNVSYADKKAIDKSASKLTKLTTNDGSITLTAITIPTVQLTLQLKGVFPYAPLEPADVATVNDVVNLQTQINQDVVDLMLQEESIPGTTQSITFDSDGNVSTVLHKNSDNIAIRTDAFTYTANTITEVRTLNTGENLTITINTSTLETTVIYSET